MDNHQFTITQGSTPTLELALPFELDAGGTAFVTFSQGDQNVLEYGLNGTPSPAYIAGTGTLSRDVNDHSLLIIKMTQADSLKLTPGDAELQVRVKTADGADTFMPLVGEIIKSHKTGVIT